MIHGAWSSRLVPALLTFSLLLLLISCTTVPNKYDQADIRVVTNNQIVEGNHFVTGWTVEEDPWRTAQSVGDDVANDLGRKGAHDIDILVELESRGTNESPNIWKISIYSAQGAVAQ